MKNAILILKNALVSRSNRASKDKGRVRGEAHLQVFLSQIHERLCPYFLRGLLQGKVCVCPSQHLLLLTHFSKVGLSSSSSDFVPFSHRFAGRPGDYVYVFGDYRMEEVIINFICYCVCNRFMSVDVDKCVCVCVFSTQCAPPGCLIELCIQLSMIMLGKQLIQNNVFEVLIPYVHVCIYQCFTTCKRLIWIDIN